MMSLNDYLQKDLVCTKCWKDIFSTLAFKELCRSDGGDHTIQYTVSHSTITHSASTGCSWCQLIVSLKDDAEGVVMIKGDPPLTELEIEFGLRDSESVQELFTPYGKNRFRLWINGYACYLTAFTRKEDPASNCVTARDLNPHVSSPEALSQAQMWLDECRSHQDCPPQQPHTLPSRLIEVSPQDDPDTPRLLSTKGCLGRYAALSYCWGKDQKGVTTEKNISSRLNRLDMNSLSRTLRDAILVTRGLGIDFLWVDSICIIQHCEDDMKVELAAMCDTYRHALVTIVAANARDANDGFLSDRRSPESSFTVPFWLPDGGLGTVSLRPEGWYDDQDEPVNGRAWTLQERLLSPRLLIYASHTLQYQCQEHTVNLGNSINIPAGFGAWRLPLGLINSSVPTNAYQLDVQSAGRMWGYIISMYSQRNLTFVRDKLRALAGLAEAFHTLVNAEYLAGLWSGYLLSRLLLWQASQSAVYLPCPQYTAPSWAWASLKSPIQFSSLYEKHTYEWYHVNVFLSAHMRLEYEALPFGRVTEGYLRFKTHVREGIFEPPQYIIWNPALGDHKVDVKLYSAAYAQIDSGLMDEKRVLLLAVSKRTYIPGESEYSIPQQMISIAFPPRTGQDGDGMWTAVDGLIIEPVADGSYRRIGCFHGADAKEFCACVWNEVTLV